MYIYLGEQIGLTEEPLPSIRLKMMRRGLQDYEYLSIIADKGPAGRALADRGRRLRPLSDGFKLNDVVIRGQFTVIRGTVPADGKVIIEY